MDKRRVLALALLVTPNIYMLLPISWFPEPVGKFLVYLPFAVIPGTLLGLVIVIIREVYYFYQHGITWNDMADFLLGALAVSVIWCLWLIANIMYAQHTQQQQRYAHAQVGGRL